MLISPIWCNFVVMNEKGHIYAPVSVNDVKTVLNADSNDVGELCMNQKINPYSLIRPMPVNVPWIEVKDMKVQHLGALPEGDGIVNWEYRQWGYQVPYVQNPSLIDNIQNISWHRPNADIEHFKNLNHFDGYRHDVEPVFMWAVGDVKQGDEIILILGFGDIQPNIVSENGQANNGGVVSVLEVFGNEPFYYGVQIKWPSGVRYAYGGPIIPGQSSSGVINTGEIARANTTYTITPFISNMNGAGQLPSGFKCYNLKFAPNYDPVKSITIPELVSGATIRALTTASDGHILTWELHLFNEFDYAVQTSNLVLNIVEQGTTQDFPMRYTMGISGTYRVEARSDAVFEIDRPIRFSGGIASTSATITASGTLTGSGHSSQFTTNIMIMENPLWINKA